MKTKILLAALAVAWVSTVASAATNNASFKGTYTFAIGSTNQYAVEYNTTGGAVGFCTGQKIPTGYNCVMQIGQDVITGTVVADGLGHVTSGSYTMRSDPNGPNKSNSGTLKGSYTVQSNGSGVLTLLPSSNAGKSAAFAMTLGANAAGQIVNLVAMPAVGNGNRGVGTAIRQ